MYFFVVFSIFLLCISNTIKELQNDTFYIIKLGEFISKNGVDLLDHYCWITDLSYTYPHWLYDLFLYMVYINFDFLGVYISVMIFFILLIFSIYFINLKFNKNNFMAIFVSFISIACLIPFVTARAQLITIILFLWQIYFIEKLIELGKKRYLCYLILISLLVANLHATIWLFSFILYLPFFAEHFIYLFVYSKFNKKIFKNSKILINKILNFKMLLLSFLLSFSVGIFTPSRICYSYVFRVMLGNSQIYIDEHAPLVITDHVCFMIFIFITLLILIFTTTKIKLRELFMICGIIFMSLISARHIIFFYTIGLFYISILCVRYFLEINDVTFDIMGNFIFNNNVIYLSSILIICIVSFFRFNFNYKQHYIPTDIYPIEAVKYIKSNLDINEINLYNNYNFGSYLLFNDIPVFIDSRCDLYLKEFNGLDYSIFDDSVNIEYVYEKKFEKYGVTHVLLYKKEIFSKILKKDSNYDVVYKDKYFILFAKK